MESDSEENVRIHLHRSIVSVVPDTYFIYFILFSHPSTCKFHTEDPAGIHTNKPLAARQQFKPPNHPAANVCFFLLVIISVTSISSSWLTANSYNNVIKCKAAANAGAFPVAASPA